MRADCQETWIRSEPTLEYETSLLVSIINGIFCPHAPPCNSSGTGAAGAGAPVPVQQMPPPRIQHLIKKECRFSTNTVATEKQNFGQNRDVTAGVVVLKMLKTSADAVKDNVSRRIIADRFTTATVERGYRTYSQRQICISPFTLPPCELCNLYGLAIVIERYYLHLANRQRYSVAHSGPCHKAYFA